MGHMERFEREPATEENGGHHRLDLVVDGNEVGEVEFQYRSKPFPHYYFSWLEVYKGLKGKGYGSKIMAQVETMLVEKGRAGVLFDDIYDEEPAAGMYARRGWKEIPGCPYYYVFNLPENVDITKAGPALMHYDSKLADRR